MKKHRKDVCSLEIYSLKATVFSKVTLNTQFLSLSFKVVASELSKMVSIHNKLIRVRNVQLKMLTQYSKMHSSRLK